MSRSLFTGNLIVHEIIWNIFNFGKPVDSDFYYVLEVIGNALLRDGGPGKVFNQKMAIIIILFRKIIGLINKTN